MTHLECSRTGARYDADMSQNLSEVGAPLLAATISTGLAAR